MLRIRARPRWSATRRLFVAGAIACICSLATAADPGGFSGRLVLELLEGIGNDHQFRLLDDLAYVDASGKIWRAIRGGIVDDEALPREFQTLAGLPYVGEYRKAAIIHSFQSRARIEPWKGVHRALYGASIAEGVGEMRARNLYAAVYAGAWRWEPHGSSCFRSCHVAAPSLAWKPATTVAEIQPVLDWIAKESPGLDEIDERLDATIRKPGPHLFAQGKE